MYKCAHNFSNIGSIVATLLVSRPRDRDFVSNRNRILHTSLKRRNRLSFSDVYQDGSTLVTLPRIVTPYRDSVDGTRDRVIYQKLVTR
jgi:hypothetical protein